MKTLIDKLESERRLATEEYLSLLDCRDKSVTDYLFARAAKVRRREFGNKVYVRGLIEISSYCKNNCYYCGIRAGNSQAERYRLSQEEILDCCARGHALGFRTFVLQGGEDPGFSSEDISSVVRAIKERHPDCAITLSLGERSCKEYQAWFDAGADRYLLRHETADATHYEKLHPPGMQLAPRLNCLSILKDIGYQVGMGFMVGSPYQTEACIAADLALIQKFQPHMVGVGPFIRHKDTPFSGFSSASLDKTLLIIAILRLLSPRLLLPATTALGSIHPAGRERGILAGANVVMPNLSPAEQRGKYSLYDNKLYTGDESAEGMKLLKDKLGSIGYKITVGRGDWRPAV